MHVTWFYWFPFCFLRITNHSENRNIWHIYQGVVVLGIIYSSRQCFSCFQFSFPILENVSNFHFTKDYWQYMQLTEKVWAKNNWHYFLKNKSTMKEIVPKIKRTVQIEHVSSNFCFCTCSFVLRVFTRRGRKGILCFSK